MFGISRLLVRRPLFILAIVASILIAAVACGEEKAATPTAAPKVAASPTTAAQPTAAPKVAASPTTAAQPTAAPTSTAVPVAARKGTFIVVNDLIGPPVFRPSLISGGAHSAFGLMDWGFYDFLLYAKYSAPPDFGELSNAGIATAWEVASDRSKITFTIRKDAKFQGGYGTVTAHDIAYSYTESMAQGTKNTRGPGLAVWIKEWVAVDDATLVANLVPGKMEPTWWYALANHGSGSTPIVSKKLKDEGGDKDIGTFAGSGAFAIKKWTSETEIIADAVDKHYRADPKIQTLKIVQISETNAKIAALKTGEAHVANIPLKFLKETKDAIPGSRLQMLGKYQPQTIYFGGNFWAKRGYQFDDKPIDKREGFKPDKDHPWIGNPDDATSMENARKVRWAMSMAIDRDSLNRNVFRGLGVKTYTYTDILPDNKLFKKEWEVPYDLAKAKQLLSEAGYPNGFSLTMWVSPDNTAAVDPEIGEAIAQMWQGIGLKTTVEKTAYAARRPTLVARSIDIPWEHHTFWLTVDEPKATTLVPSAGFNHGIELPEEMGMIRWKNITEPDFNKRLENNLKLQDYLSHWQLMASTVTMQPYWVVRPEVVEWKPHQLAWSMFNSPETVVLK